MLHWYRGMTERRDYRHADHHVVLIGSTCGKKEKQDLRRELLWVNLASS